ncbi:disease resistance protein RPP2A-like isoform X3 [Carya illinoinensis]|uniref:disease resistance protein RPP2A-like isoform X3 n=1 Tax=Carya illinoinensis TaxID=32201 RepID=UPI001C729992|nr:disease resistance protein RPP2A-like isoform X3 [Carya illinoinensis]
MDMEDLLDIGLDDVRFIGISGMSGIEIGPEIVCDESREEPGQRSRLWAWKDVLHVLNNNTGTEQVKGIVLDFPPQRDQEHLNADAFSKMKKFRFLKISVICTFLKA